MLQNSEIIFDKLKTINQKVKNQLFQKGFIPPVKNPDGSIQVGNLKIIKKSHLFCVVDRHDVVLADNINLPQSAILIANNLGLRKSSVTKIIEKDYRYGHYVFDEMNLKVVLHKTKDGRKKEILKEKLITSTLNKKKYKQDILDGFSKLIKIA
ncbi:MAG: hypothetical protein EBX47_06535 [Synechococcaceae bacterium WB8_1B_057]|nr:hypothetical protein [Synechococcaceae bacterium WB6_1A_059]NDG79071.1 hypothetical protein [Synechococcaceae bacterium WB8_1B_057]